MFGKLEVVLQVFDFFGIRAVEVGDVLDAGIAADLIDDGALIAICARFFGRYIGGGVVILVLDVDVASYVTDYGTLIASGVCGGSSRLFFPARDMQLYRAA